MFWSKVVRTVAPSALPVTLGELKAHLRIEDGDTSQDTLLTLYLNAAVDAFDGRAGLLGRALITQTWQWYFPDFPENRKLYFGCAPIQSVTVRYHDLNDVHQTLSASLYRLVEDALNPFVELDDTATWPQVSDRADAAWITSVCGYGDASAVPAQIKLGILMLAADFFLNREGQQSGMMRNPMFQSIIASYRTTGI